MSVLLFLFLVSVSLPDAWGQDATITEVPTEVSDTSQPEDNQTTQEITTVASTQAGTTTFPTQSPDVVSRYLS